MNKLIFVLLTALNCCVYGHDSLESAFADSMLGSNVNATGDIKCDYTKSYVICPGVGKQFNLYLVDNNVQYMAIQNNNIKEMPSWVMRRFQHLKVLDIEANQVQDLQLNSNAELTTIQADSNMLGTGSKFRGSLKNMFKRNTKLAVASLRNNGIRRLSSAMANTRNNDLFELNLAKNWLRVIGTNTFSYLKKLQRLYIHENNITYIKKDAFKKNTELQYLDLCDNAIDFTGSNNQLDLSSNKKLLALYMSNNKLSSISKLNLLESTSLEHLDLSFNRIQSVGVYDLFRNNQLLHLNLSYNLISTISPGAFAYLANLQHLDLSGNDLTALPATLFRNLRNLQVLSLARNQLSSLYESQFVGNGRLTALNLSGNNLRIWEPATVSKNINLRYLDLSDNRFAVDDVEYFHPRDGVVFDIEKWASDSHEMAQESESVRSAHDALNKIVFARLSCLRLGGNPMSVQAYKAAKIYGVRFQSGPTGCQISADTWYCGCVGANFSMSDWIRGESDLHLR